MADTCPTCGADYKLLVARLEELGAHIEVLKHKRKVAYAMIMDAIKWTGWPELCHPLMLALRKKFQEYTGKEVEEYTYGYEYRTCHIIRLVFFRSGTLPGSGCL